MESHTSSESSLLLLSLSKKSQKFRSAIQLIHVFLKSSSFIGLNSFAPDVFALCTQVLLSPSWLCHDGLREEICCCCCCCEAAYGGCGVEHGRGVTVGE